MRRLLRPLVLFMVCSVAVPMSVTATVLAAFIFLPLPAVLPETRAGEASGISHVYAVDANGKPVEIAVFREFEQNIPVNPQDIPEHLKQAVISSEDKSFYRHGGVDIKGSMRALLADVRGGGLVQGGSTITQQYVKNAYTGKERTITRKVREAILASQLDRQADKEEILFKYLSSIYFGEGAYGVGAASETYFRKPVSQLTVSEAAMLAGLIPAPSRYEPRGNPEGAELKRKIVLRKMLEQGYIDQATHDDAVAHPVWRAADGGAPGPSTVIYPPVEVQTQYPYFVDYVKRYLIERYGPEAVFRGGLQIQTTLDLDMQAAADQQVRSALGGTVPNLEMSLVAVEPPTGFVKALVGGRDFYAPGGQVNLALGKCPTRPAEMDTVEVEPTCWDESESSIEGGGTGRQPGSSWKPFVLAAAFEKGIPPTKVYPAPSKICIGTYCPQNYEGGGGGSASLRSATHRSYNTVYVKLGEEVGVKNVMETAKKLGVTSSWYNPRQHGLSLSLGAQEVAPLDMASAYGVFANSGKRAEPTPVVKVVDREGKVLEDNTDPDTKQVIDAVIADNVTDVLKGVISGGTGTRAKLSRPAAGKTGTAQEWRDAWFVGYTPTLSTAVWMGYKDKPATMANIKGNRRVAGGTIPAATWGAFMKEALKGVPVTDFNEPAPIKRITDALNRKARNSIDPGSKRSPADTEDGGPYVFEPPPPTATPPSSTSSSTTSTSQPDDGGPIFP
jgi:penicillin-binding protein 1A